MDVLQSQISLHKLRMLTTVNDSTMESPGNINTTLCSPACKPCISATFGVNSTTIPRTGPVERNGNGRAGRRHIAGYTVCLYGL